MTENPYKITELGETDEEIAAIYPVMHQLRDQLDEETFKARYLSMYEGVNYRIAALSVDGDYRAAAGFRWVENLAVGVSLYIDDLVTLDQWRSQGYGANLVKYLGDFAVQAGADAVRLDSATFRVDAHRFYEREGFVYVSKHFWRQIHR